MVARDAAAAFSEKAFYLQEFRGRTLLFVVPEAELAAAGPLAGVLAELSANETRSVVVSTSRPGLEKLVGTPPLEMDTPGLPGEVWRGLRTHALVGVAADGALAPAAREVALRLRVGKLVYLDEAGGWTRPDGSQASFVGLDELRRSAEGEGAPLLREIRALLEAGLPAVNLCSQAGLADELFSYAGSGTLFTREGYVTVRRLSLDDYDAAADLVARGVEEGYLAPRTPDEVDAVLAQGFGAFVEDVHLAGIGALLVHPAGESGEIASLYTLTRFVGEGVGRHLVAFAMDEARRRGLGRVFACTTSPRVAAFFERNGFAAVRSDELPPEKWQGYDWDRRARVLCLARTTAAG